MFSTHKEMDGEHLYMKNSTSKVLDIGKDLLKMTYKKKLALNYMLHIAHIRMNLMFGSLLSKNGSKLIFKSDKFILFKNKACIWEEYFSDDLLKIKVMINVTMDEKKNNYNTYFSYIFESYNKWHGMLGNVNSNFI